jgi:hypothetical protein
MKLGGGVKDHLPTAMWLNSDLMVYNVNKSAPKVWDSENEETIVLSKSGKVSTLK